MYLVIVLSVLSLFPVNVYGVLTCKTVGSEKWISGMQGHKDYEQYNRNCIKKEDVIVRYIRCLIDGVMLNVTEISHTYPNLRVVYWQCRGYCTISSPSTTVHVYGCKQSKYILMFS